MVVRTSSRNDLARRDDFSQNSENKSRGSPTESPTIENDGVVEETIPPWITNQKATSFVAKLLTCMYFLFLTLISFLISLSSSWNSSKMWLAETIFSIIMYLIAIIFFLYIYIFIIYQKPFNNFILFLNRHTKLIQRPDRFLIEDPSHVGEGAGTLYLRLGAIFFGTLGSVLWGCEIYLRMSDPANQKLTSAKYIVAIIFTFLQIHFIFCNSKIVFKKTNLVISFGLMHCVAVNLWTWFSMCLVKAEVKKVKSGKKLVKIESSSSSSSEEEEHSEISNLTQIIVEKVVETITNNTVGNKIESSIRLQSIPKLGDFSSFLLTCLVEYSLIGAAVCFIIWKSTSEVHLEELLEKGKKKQFRFECRNTTIGLFIGIFFTIGACITIGIGSIIYKEKQCDSADLVTGIVTLILFIVALIGCILGLWRTRFLEYRLHAHGEVIDEILLIIALIGEFLYSSLGIFKFYSKVYPNSGIYVIANTRVNNCKYLIFLAAIVSIGFDLILLSKENQLATSKLSIVVFTFRIIQVIMQSTFILIASRLRCLSKKNIDEQPGKQILTFLMVINVTLFLYHNYEAMHSYYGFPKQMSSMYSTLLNVFSPLVVFYRFHSSVCIAEIWKHTYSSKPNHRKITSHA